MDETRTEGYSEHERSLADSLINEHYDTLVRIARAKRRRAGMGETYNTTDLMHESFVRLNGRADFNSKPHFLRACMLAMRHVIIDYARRKLSEKHGAGAAHMQFEDAEPWLPEFSETPEQLVGIAQLLTQMEGVNPRWLQVVDARYFSGMTELETAITLGLSERTVRRDWSEARAWLAQELGRS